MDARRQPGVQRPASWPNGTGPQRLTPDRAIALADLVKELEGDERPPNRRGRRGTALLRRPDRRRASPPILAPQNLRMQSAWGVARTAIRAGPDRPDRSPAASWSPIYHRLSQAERERLEREEAAKNKPPKTD